MTKEEEQVKETANTVFETDTFYGANMGARKLIMRVSKYSQKFKN